LAGKSIPIVAVAGIFVFGSVLPEPITGPHKPPEFKKQIISFNQKWAVSPNL
jgi:hypothetical protein